METTIVGSKETNVNLLDQKLASIASLPKELHIRIFGLAMKSAPKITTAPHKYLRTNQTDIETDFVRQHDKLYNTFHPSLPLRKTVSDITKAFDGAKDMRSKITKVFLLEAYCTENFLTAVLMPDPHTTPPKSENDIILSGPDRYIIMHGTFEAHPEIEKHVRYLSIHAVLLSNTLTEDMVINEMKAVLMRCPKLIEVVLSTSWKPWHLSSCPQTCKIWNGKVTKMVEDMGIVLGRQVKVSFVPDYAGRADGSVVLPPGSKGRMLMGLVGKEFIESMARAKNSGSQYTGIRQSTLGFVHALQKDTGDMHDWVSAS